MESLLDTVLSPEAKEAMHQLCQGERLSYYSPGIVELLRYAYVRTNNPFTGAVLTGTGFGLAQALFPDIDPDQIPWLA